MSYPNPSGPFFQCLTSLTVSLIPIEVQNALFVNLFRRVHSVFLALPPVCLTANPNKFISKPLKNADFPCLERSPNSTGMKSSF